MKICKSHAVARSHEVQKALEEIAQPNQNQKITNPDLLEEGIAQPNQNLKQGEVSS